jgi:hypothetical protein
MTSMTVRRSVLRCKYCNEPILDGEGVPRVPVVVHRGPRDRQHLKVPGVPSSLRG